MNLGFEDRSGLFYFLLLKFEYRVVAEDLEGGRRRRMCWPLYKRKEFQRQPTVVKLTVKPFRRRGGCRTIDRDFCDNDWFKMRGRRSVVITITTPPRLNRNPSWSLLRCCQQKKCETLERNNVFRSSCTVRNVGKGRMISAISETMLKTPIVIKLAKALEQAGSAHC